MSSHSHRINTHVSNRQHTNHFAQTSAHRAIVHHAATSHRAAMYASAHNASVNSHRAAMERSSTQTAQTLATHLAAQRQSNLNHHTESTSLANHHYQPYSPGPLPQVTVYNTDKNLKDLFTIYMTGIASLVGGAVGWCICCCAPNACMLAPVIGTVVGSGCGVGCMHCINKKD